MTSPILLFLYVAVVIDTDGSAFITKAEFDSLKNNFQAQIDAYNTSIDSKIDGAIAAYLAGIQLESEVPFETILTKIQTKFPDKKKIFFRMKKDYQYDGDTWPIGDETDSWVYGRRSGGTGTSRPDKIYLYHYSLRIPLKGSVLDTNTDTWVGEGNWEMVNKGNYSEGLYSDNFNANPHFCPIGSQYQTYTTLTYTGLEIGKPLFIMSGLFIGAYSCNLTIFHDVDTRESVDYWIGGSGESTNEYIFNMSGKRLNWSNAYVSDCAKPAFAMDIDTNLGESFPDTNKYGFCLGCGYYNTYAGSSSTLGSAHASDCNRTGCSNILNYTETSPWIRTIYIPRWLKSQTSDRYYHARDSVTSWVGTLKVYDKKLTTSQVYGPEGSSTYRSSWDPALLVVRTTWGACKNNASSGNSRCIVPAQRKTFRSYYEKSASGLTESVKMDNGFPIIKADKTGKIKLGVKTDIAAVYSAWCGDSGCTTWGGMRSSMEGYTCTTNKIAANTETEIVIDNVTSNNIVYLVMTPQSSSAKGVTCEILSSKYITE